MFHRCKAVATKKESHGLEMLPCKVIQMGGGCAFEI